MRKRFGKALPVVVNSVRFHWLDLTLAINVNTSCVPHKEQPSYHRKTEAGEMS